MATQGALIRAIDYNTVQSNINKILGVGVVDFGYGQSLYSSPVSTSDLVQAQDWAKLKLDMLAIASHQGTQSNPLITALPTVTAGADIQDTDATAFENAVPFLTANRFLLAEFSDESFSPDISQVRTTVWGAPAKPTVRHSFTLDFGNSNNARYFFNSGSSIRIAPSFIGTTATSRNLAWTNLLSSIGMVTYNYGGATAYSGTGSGIGFYSLTNVAQTVFTKAGIGSYIYTANDYTITMSCNVANNNTGTARYIYVSVYFNDDSTETIDGTLTQTVSVRRASGSNVDVAIPNATNTILLTA